MPTLIINSVNWFKGRTLKEIRVLFNNSLCDYAAFFYFLPNDYTCIIKKMKKDNFSFRINLYYSDDMVFHLFVNDDFSAYIFLLDEKGFKLNWKKEDNFFTLIFPENEFFGERKLPQSHPYVIIGKKFNKIHKYHNKQFLSLFVDGNILNSIRKHDKYLQRNFIEYIKNNFPGSIIIYQTNLKSRKLIQLDENQYVFGLSWIFPWAASLLFSCNYNCYMIDATFKALKPYTLLMLLIIINNESLPIGLSVSPTETANSYGRLWDHLIQCCKIFNIDINYFIKQKTFLADLGTAIKKFINDNNFNIKYCHRHFIEKFGSSSIIGNWVSRIIKASNLSEFEIISNIIKNELQIIISSQMQNNLNTEKFQNLLMVLGLKHPNFDHTTDKWAKWLRPGCPTTTNALESMHHHINATIPFKGSFIDKLKNVKTVLWNRFNTRNEWHGNNLNKYISKLKKIQQVNKKLLENACVEITNSILNYIKTNILHANIQL